ncbi:MAG TPA: hypothetical protein PKV43_13090, partial [Armatimonadota bacterium]|nr:hypothetical protein [Armatimonadota bacterium]
LTPYKVPISDILQVIGAFTVGIGLYSLGSIHGKSIAKRRPGWYNSFAFFAALVLMTLFAFFKEYLPANTDGRIISESIYKILFSGGLAALQATMFSLVAFYIVSAAYRAFRIKSSEAALMMMAAFFVMIGVVTFGMWLTNGLSGSLTSLRLENIQSWIMEVPNTAAQRGMMFGIGVGGLAMALRLWLSLERGSFFDKQL